RYKRRPSAGPENSCRTGTGTLRTPPKEVDPVLGRSMSIFSGNAHPALADEICKYLDCPRGRSRVTQFSDGETFSVIEENVRGVDTYVVQPACAPVNDRLMELLIMVDALRRASAGSITAVIPYYGYAR